jgi:hypothetical protein
VRELRHGTARAMSHRRARSAEVSAPTHEQPVKDAKSNVGVPFRAAASEQTTPGATGGQQRGQSLLVVDLLRLR